MIALTFRGHLARSLLFATSALWCCGSPHLGARGQNVYLAAARRASTEGPLQVVALLAQWDSAETRFDNSGRVRPDVDSAYQSLVCWLPDTECTTDEPGWDMATFIRRYSIRLLWQRRDSAQVEVEYEVVAESGDRPRIVPKAGVTRWQPLLRRLDGRWRVVGAESQQWPHESIGTARRQWALTRADSAVLDSIEHSPRPR
jgi:hypothetical protein